MSLRASLGQFSCCIQRAEHVAGLGKVENDAIREPDQWLIVRQSVDWRARQPWLQSVSATALRIAELTRR